jgi:hypothetical protein
MKRCDNCLEPNSDGATHCVICGESLDVAQVEAASEGLIDDADLEVIAEQPAESAVSSSELMIDLEEHEVSAPASVTVPLADELPPPPAPPIDISAEALPAGEAIAAIAASNPVPSTDVASPPPSPAPSLTGKLVIEVYHDSEPRVVHTHPVVNDITLIGREDPQRDVFPDLDLGKLERLGVSATRVSREHLRLLRLGHRFYLYIYPGTTGTQVNKNVIDESRYSKKFEVQIGDRIILGGKARLKLTVQE